MVRFEGGSGCFKTSRSVEGVFHLSIYEMLSSLASVPGAGWMLALCGGIVWALAELSIRDTVSHRGAPWTWAKVL